MIDIKTFLKYIVLYVLNLYEFRFLNLDDILNHWNAAVDDLHWKNIKQVSKKEERT